MTKSFELAWKEYKEYCAGECADDRRCLEDLDSELETTKQDYRHFYEFLLYSGRLEPKDELLKED